MFPSKYTHQQQLTLDRYVTKVTALGVKFAILLSLKQIKFWTENAPQKDLSKRKVNNQPDIISL